MANKIDDKEALDERKHSFVPLSAGDKGNSGSPSSCWGPEMTPVVSESDESSRAKTENSSQDGPTEATEGRRDITSSSDTSRNDLEDAPLIVDPVKALSFPAKLHAILSRRDLSDTVSWMPHGRSWRVHKPKPFEMQVIPEFFVHCKYSSFIRQANGWGFRRITQGPDRNSYYHECFLRGRLQLCQNMRRPATSHKSRSDPEHEPNFYQLSELDPLPELGEGDDAVSDVIVDESGMRVADRRTMVRRLSSEDKQTAAMTAAAAAAVSNTPSPPISGRREPLSTDAVPSHISFVETSSNALPYVTSTEVLPPSTASQMRHTSIALQDMSKFTQGQQQQQGFQVMGNAVQAHYATPAVPSTSFCGGVLTDVTNVNSNLLPASNMQSYNNSSGYHAHTNSSQLLAFLNGGVGGLSEYERGMLQHQLNSIAQVRQQQELQWQQQLNQIHLARLVAAVSGTSGADQGTLELFSMALQQQQQQHANRERQLFLEQELHGRNQERAAVTGSANVDSMPRRDMTCTGPQTLMSYPPSANVSDNNINASNQRLLEAKLLYDFFGARK